VKRRIKEMQKPRRSHGEWFSKIISYKGMIAGASFVEISHNGRQRHTYIARNAPRDEKLANIRLVNPRGHG
jgi:hypothetical protein